MNKGKRLSNAHYFSPIFLTGFSRFNLASILFDLSFSHYNDLTEIKNKKKILQRGNQKEREVYHTICLTHLGVCARDPCAQFSESGFFAFLDLGFNLLGSLLPLRDRESEITEEAWMGILGFVEGGF